MAFEKGKSGNPAGRPRGFAGLAAEIRERTGDGRALVDYALRVFEDEKAEPSDRWAALQWLSDRGFGKPLQSVDLQGALVADLTARPGAAIDAPRILARLSIETLRELAAATDERAPAGLLGDGGAPKGDE